ncbi:MAG: protein kinase domain-containing protein [Planctomycetota bacterium]
MSSSLTGKAEDKKLRELTVWRRLMEVCQQYEAAYQRGERPPLSQLAHEFSESDRSMVLDELQRVQSELSAEQLSVQPAIDGRFIRMEPLARGGMGEVSVARDAAFQRNVAIKEIRSGAADDQRYRSRFVREAEITAQLEHPGIIPVYAGGEQQDGRPYYVMRLIHGDQTGTLQDGIRQLHDPTKTPVADFEASLRRLVRRLLDVCNTMAYAHSRGVIHRDLKPANILLGAYGETLVVDWGLARSLDPGPQDLGTAISQGDSTAEEASETPGTSGIGTPGYAAPEQLRLHNPVVGVTSDVYSLGTILYSLLTGRPPFSASDSSTPEQFVERVAAGDFRPPRAINPLAPLALEAVCLRAMQTDPERRYPTAAALAMELERWLADDPVEAWVEPLSFRLRRWMLRHRAAAALGFASLLMSILALAAITVLQSDHNRTLNTRQRELSKALQQVESEKKLADAERLRANEQRERAESREQLAISAIDRFRTAIADDPLLQNSAQLAELRQRLLTQPIAYYRELAQQLQSTDEASPVAVTRFAQVNLALAQQHTTVGEWQQAVELLANTITLLQTKLQSAEAGSRLHRDLSLLLALSLQQQGQLHDQRRSAATEAEAALRQALEILHKLASEAPEPELPAIHASTADTCSGLAAVLGRNDRSAEAVPLLQEAIRQLQQISWPVGRPTATQLKLADLHTNLGVSLVGIEQQEQAASEYAAAADIYAAVETQTGLTDTLKFRKAGLLYNLGRLQEFQNRPTRALTEHKQALQLRRSLHLDFPSVHDYRLAALTSRERVVELQLKTGAVAEAIETGKTWVEDARKIAELGPGHLEYRIQLMDSLHSLGHIYAVTGRSLDAEPAYREALTINSELLTLDSTIPLRARTHAELLEHVAQIDCLHKNFQAARTALEQAIPLQRTWIQNNPPRPLDRPYLKQMLETLARCCDQLGDADAAANARKQAAMP